MDEAGGGPMLERHHGRCSGSSRRRRSRIAPAHDFTAAEVHYGRQIKPALAGRDVGDAREPDSASRRPLFRHPGVAASALDPTSAEATTLSVERGRIAKEPRGFAARARVVFGPLFDADRVLVPPIKWSVDVRKV